MQSYGFVGTGELTAAIVEGLSTDVPAPPRVFLSPRNHGIARDLAGRFVISQDFGDGSAPGHR